MTDRPTTPSAQLSAFLSRFSPDIVTLAKSCLTKLRRDFPGATQIVYDYSNSVVVGFGASERGYESIVALAISAREVKLYFDKSLPDPKNLLAGSGTKVRSVTLESASDLDSKDVQALLEAAIKKSGVALPIAVKSQMIIKSGSKRGN